MLARVLGVQCTHFFVHARDFTISKQCHLCNDRHYHTSQTSAGVAMQNAHICFLAAFAAAPALLGLCSPALLGLATYFLPQLLMRHHSYFGQSRGQQYHIISPARPMPFF